MGTVSGELGPVAIESRLADGTPKPDPGFWFPGSFVLGATPWSDSDDASYARAGHDTTGTTTDRYDLAYTTISAAVAPTAVVDIAIRLRVESIAVPGSSQQWIVLAGSSLLAIFVYEVGAPWDGSRQSFTQSLRALLSETYGLDDATVTAYIQGAAATVLAGERVYVDPLTVGDTSGEPRYGSVFEFELDFVTAAAPRRPTTTHPVRRYPREDGAGISGRRLYPPPRTSRVFGGHQ